jgi:succinoglycan biosynthesis protein ExoO
MDKPQPPVATDDLVSIIVPAYNVAEYLQDCISSALNQTHQNVEVIVIDDCSTDETETVLQRVSRQDSRIRAFRNSVNRGLSATRNRAIDAAGGTWVALLDADDWFDPSRLAHLLAIARTRSADVVADNLYFIDDGKETPWRTLLPRSFQNVTQLDLLEYLRNDRPDRFTTYALFQPIIRRSFLIENEVRYDDNTRFGEDSEFLAKLLYHGARFFISSLPQYYYRQRQGSLVASKSMADLLQSRASAYRLASELRDAGPVVSDLLSARCKRVDRFIEMQEVIRPLKRRDYKLALKQLTRHGRCLPFLLAHLARVGHARLLQRTVPLRELR